MGLYLKLTVKRLRLNHGSCSPSRLRQYHVPAQSKGSQSSVSSWKTQGKEKDLYIKHGHETRLSFGDLRKSPDCSGYLVNHAKKLQKKVFHSQNFDANWTRNALIQSLRIYKCLKQFFFFQTPLAMSSKLLCSCQENLNCPQLAISR